MLLLLWSGSEYDAANPDFRDPRAWMRAPLRYAGATCIRISLTHVPYCSAAIPQSGEREVLIASSVPFDGAIAGNARVGALSGRRIRPKMANKPVSTMRRKLRDRGQSPQVPKPGKYCRNLFFKTLSRA